MRAWWIFPYRYNTDDWDLTSHTLETHYRYYFAGNFTVNCIYVITNKRRLTSINLS